MTTKNKPLPRVGGAAGMRVRALFHALDELERGGMIECWSASQNADGKWTFRLKSTEACAGKFTNAVFDYLDEVAS